MIGKKCKRCGITKPLKNFSFLKGSGRYSYYCRECLNKTRRHNYKLNHDNTRKSINKYRSQKKVKKSYLQYRIDNTYMIKAHTAFNKAVQRGYIKRKPCEVCGKKNAWGHHENYRYPYNVIWLCPLHHRQLHLGIITL